MSSLLFSSKAKRELAAKEDEEVKKKQQERMEQESEQSKRRFLAKAQQAEANDEQSTKRKTLEEEEGNAEIEMIKEQYLGKKKAKPVQKKISRSKFMFEWDAEKEDTSNPGDTYQVQLAFGRGSLGGMEKQEDTGRVMNRVKVKEEEALLKSRHWSEKKLEEMNERDWRIFNEDFNITTRGGSIPKPIRSWEEANLPNELLQTLLRVGYKEPTPVQRAAIPIGRQNRDLMAIAETGSGKTVAFVIPMLVILL
jgi:ATP-dependent RNA helicase DDX23/PRP28